MSFRKPRHMPFRKLILPFTLINEVKNVNKDSPSYHRKSTRLKLK